jgi:hypothetical protein
MKNSLPKLALVSLVVWGCGDDGETNPPPEGVTYSGTITQAVLGSPVAGAEVCIADPPGECVSSDASGAYSISNVPKNTQVEFQVKAPGFINALGVFDVKDVDRNDINAALLDEQIAVGLFEDAGITYDPTQGAIVAAVSDPAVMHGASGYSFTLTPSAGEGPYYTSPTAVLPSATATTDAGGVGFINLPAGDYTVEATGPGACTSNAIVANGPSSWPARVRAGFLTYIVAECPDGTDGSGGGGAGSGSGGSGGAGGGGGAGAGAG